MSHFRILPECYADTLLIEILGFKRPNHHMGIGQFKNALSVKFKNGIAVGIIDNDKRKPTGFQEFESDVEETSIQRRFRPNTRHTLLVICPAFEDWIFENAIAVDVDPSRYGFRSRKHFRETCKQTNVSENGQLKSFLNTLKQRNAPGFIQLKTWICEGAGIDENEL